MEIVFTGLIGAVGRIVAEDQRKVALEDGFEGWDRGRENSNVGFDYRPVHGGADSIGGVGGRKKAWDEGDANNRGEAGPVFSVRFYLLEYYRRHIQEAKTKHYAQTNLLPGWHLQMPHQINGKDVGEDIGEDVQRCIRQVEHVNIDAVTAYDCQVPRFSHGTALE